MVQYNIVYMHCLHNLALCCPAPLGLFLFLYKDTCMYSFDIDVYIADHSTANLKLDLSTAGVC